jgi:hypothetical protein
LNAINVDSQTERHFRGTVWNTPRASPQRSDRRNSEVTDIFFSYSAKDRERVRPIYEALTSVGFDIFWDLQIPAGKDWDTHIKEQLAEARSAVVFWSLASIASDNVRHEATVAKEQESWCPSCSIHCASSSSPWVFSTPKRRGCISGPATTTILNGKSFC